MSCVFVLTPMMVLGFAGAGGLVALVTAVGVGMGFRVVRDLVQMAQTSPIGVTSIHPARERKDYYKIELDVPNAQIVGETMNDEVLTLQKDDVTISFTQTPDGYCRVHVAGESKTRKELEELGQQVLGRILQTYALEKIKSEMGTRGYDLIQESEEADQSVRLRLRRWA